MYQKIDGWFQCWTWWVVGVSGNVIQGKKCIRI
jgi:hypothetical protein